MVLKEVLAPNFYLNPAKKCSLTIKQIFRKKTEIAGLKQSVDTHTTKVRRVINA